MKTTRFLLITLALCCAATLHAAKPELRLWSDGPLQWSDFREPVALDSEQPSYLSVELSATPVENTGDAGTVRLEARAIMRPNKSGAIPEARTPERLRYHQTQFDLLELMRRHLQEEINSGIDGAQVEQRLKHYQDLYRQRARELARETQNGAIASAVERWDDNISAQLQQMGTPRVPQVTARQFCYGAYAGLGFDAPMGSLRDNFGNSAMFHVGLTGGYKRLRLKADVAFGQPSYRNDNIFNTPPDEQGRPLQGNNSGSPTHFTTTVQLGYTVFSHNRLSITPNAGLYFNRYGWDVANYKWSTDDDGNDVRETTSVEARHLQRASFVVSVDFDINLSSRVSNTSLTGYAHRERWTSSIRISPYVAHSRFTACDPTVSGVHVGVNVSYLGLARLLRF